MITLRVVTVEISVWAPGLGETAAGWGFRQDTTETKRQEKNRARTANDGEAAGEVNYSKARRIRNSKVGGCR